MPKRPAGSITHEVLYNNTEYVQENREVDEIKKGSANLTSGTINIYRVGGRGQDWKETWQRRSEWDKEKQKRTMTRRKERGRPLASRGGSDGKEPACNEGDLGSIPRLGRSLEKRTATHSSILAWRIPWPGEPGGYSPGRCKESDATETLN